MSKKEEPNIEYGRVRIWLVSGSFIDVDVEFNDNNPIESIEFDLERKSWIIYLPTDLIESKSLVINTQYIVGYEWIQ